MAALTPAEAILKVDRLMKKLDAQATDANKWRDYYDGKQKLTFSSLEWREWFGKQYDGFSDNWCRPVVEATAERQRLVGFRPYEALKADADLSRVISINGADVDFALAATEAQYARRAFMMVWPNSADTATPIVTFESPTQVFVEYVAGSRRVVAAALKRWDDDEYTYATLYMPTNIYKFQRRRATASGIVLPASFGAGWSARVVEGEQWPLGNKMGEVPITELPNRTTLTGEPLSAIEGVAAMQDAINLIWAHLFTASDFAALPQRIILGASLPKIPVLNAEGVKIGEKTIDLPEANYRRIINLESPTAKVDSWAAAELEGFLKVITRARAHIADQTRTPSYYFSGESTIANISGDTVKALDAGLVKKVRGVNESMRDGLRNGARLICLAQGDKRKAAAMAAGTVLYGDPEIRSDAQRADAMGKLRTMGMPFAWVAGQLIEDPDELATVIEQYEAERGDPTLERISRDLNQTVTTPDLTAA